MTGARAKQYYALTKPGIIYGNALPTIATFLLASARHINLWLFVAVLVGQSLIIASGCVYNNYMDRGIDKKMVRTSQRALVTGEIAGQNALVFATMLGLVGSFVLITYVNWLTFAVGMFGLFVYVIAYGFTKRRGPYGTLVGSIAGALPPVAGYTAVTNHINAAAVILFFILVFWQMPHFYAIALRRKQDYAAAKLPVLAVMKSARNSKIQIMAYVVAFEVAALSLKLFGYAGETYVLVTLIVSSIWLYKGLRGFRSLDDTAWAKSMFLFSLIVLTVLCSAIASSPWLI